MTSNRFSRKLGSPIFTIITRNEKGDHLTAHKTVLENSPVFEAMCNGAFMEGQSQIIDLPEDDYNDIAFLLHFLYTGAIDIDLDDAPKAGKAYNVGLLVARLYILADKYKVENLKTPLSEFIDDVDGELRTRKGYVVGSVIAYLRAACEIYENTPASDQIFRTKFRAIMKETFREKTNEEIHVAPIIKETLMKGGELAFDIFEAQRLAWAPDLLTLDYGWL